MLLRSNDCFNKYGNPVKESNMILFDVPKELEVGAIPNKVYCNKDLVYPLKAALVNIKIAEIGSQIKTWDGCFNIRGKRGHPSSYSLHSWGVAIDINATWNRMGHTPTLSKELVAAFMDTGLWDWGGYWGIPDGMHLQLSRKAVGL